MHVITVLFRIKPEHYSEFVPAILDNASTSLAVESGCLQFDVCEGGEGECLVFLYEIYRTPADFAAHLVQPHFLQFDALASPWIVDKSVQIFTRVEQCRDAEDPKHDS